MSRQSILTVCFVAAFTLAGAASGQVTASPDGASGATTGNHLPSPTPPFKGVIGQTYKDSKSDFPQPVTPPRGAPNVLLVLIDDLGFGGTSAYGGQTPTPNLDKIAAEGLRFNEMHNTALCSPSRAALLSGRNHHQVGMGSLTEGATGFPGYNSLWTDDNAAIGQVLKYNGYSTAAFGKWHDTPDWETSSAGPFDRWPTGKGFDYYYGFQGGESDQYYPQLYLNTAPVEPDRTPEQGYTLNEDLANHAINWLRQQQSVAPNKPWFVYYAPGGTHAPHQVPKAYIERLKGKFDMGWDKYREMVFANQKKLGIIPANAKLTPRPAEIPAWDSLSADQKRVYARQMEVFSAYLAQTDEQVGRVLDAVRNSPGGDNTLIILALGDNGASAEGGLTGSLNSIAVLNGLPDSLPEMLKHIDDLGSPKFENHYSVGWAWAVDTPFQWTKQVASHFGGSRSGFTMEWPAKIKAHGEIRSQWHHFIDVAPTIYEATGITMPEYVNGLKQVPLPGVSMVYTFDNATAPSRHTTQYFEIYGNRAIYHDGWIAAARHGLPWVTVGKKGDFEKDTWELYDLNDDFSEANDLASKEPAKLKEMQALFQEEAKKYNVLPLDDRFAERANVPDRPSQTRGRTSFTYYPGTFRVPEGSAPNVKMRSHEITAVFNADDKTQGVIVAAGGSAGYTLFVQDGYLFYENNFFGRERDQIKSSIKLPHGQVTAQFRYTQEAKTYAGGGTGVLLINGKEVGRGHFAHVVPARYSATETFDVGRDTGEAVSESYRAPFPFTGTLDHVTVDIAPQQLSAATAAQIKEGEDAAAMLIQ